MEDPMGTNKTYLQMGKTKISIIIPAYNEAQSIGDVIKKIIMLYPDFEIIVVNDGSTDDTASVARDAGALVYSHPYNIGNGAAVKSGIRFSSGKILVFMDGDGQHDPKDIQAMLQHFPDYDMVVGARKKSQQAFQARRFGNRIFNWLASYVAKSSIQDLTSGFRVKYIHINTQSRQKGKSKIKIFRDGLRFFLIITKICALYSPLRIFLPVSFMMFCLGLGYYLYTFFAWGRFTNMSALLFTTSILIFMMGLISEQICQMRFERSEGDKFI
jgi:glycosyltransferase involved in cell wall biosynthesis